MSFPFYVLLGLILGPSGFQLTAPPALLFKICAAGFLLASGLECSFDGMRKQLKVVIGMSLGAFLIPLALGLLTAPLFNLNTLASGWVFATAMSVSALPVIIQILRERKLLHNVLGQIVVASASLCDIAAWVCFMLILPREHQSTWIWSHFPVLFFFIGLFWKLFFPLPTAFFNATDKASRWIFAPIFFIGIGLQLDIWNTFNLWLTIGTIVLALVGKIGGGLLAAKLLKLPKKEAWIISVALSARGAMEVLLAQLAFHSKLISEMWFTILIIMAIVTSLTAGPWLRYLQNSKKQVLPSP